MTLVKCTLLALVILNKRWIMLFVSAYEHLAFDNRYFDELYHFLRNASVIQTSHLLVLLVCLRQADP